MARAPHDPDLEELRENQAELRRYAREALRLVDESIECDRQWDSLYFSSFGALDRAIAGLSGFITSFRPYQVAFPEVAAPAHKVLAKVTDGLEERRSEWDELPPFPDKPELPGWFQGWLDADFEEGLAMWAKRPGQDPPGTAPLARRVGARRRPA